MFADENTFFSPAPTTEFLSSEPRKSLGSLTPPLSSPPFAVADDINAHPDSFSQELGASQKTGVPPGGPPGAGGPQAPDGCVCATVSMLKKAIRARTGGGALQLNGADVGLVCLCGISHKLEIRASLIKFSLEDITGFMEVECSHKGAILAVKEEEEKDGDSQKLSSAPAGPQDLGKALRGGVVTVYGFPCTDDKGEVYIDCMKVCAVTDMREYVELFPLRVLAGAMHGVQQSKLIKNEINGGPSEGPFGEATDVKHEGEGEIWLCGLSIFVFFVHLYTTRAYM